MTHARVLRFTGPITFAAALLFATVSASAQLNIALTNDDGWNSVGIQAAKDALVAAGHAVTLAGPLNEQSGSSAAINTGGLVIAKQREIDGVPEFSVALTGGTESAEPATSGLIAIAIAKQRAGRLPDLVVSGINNGANIGSATQISGTVGATIVALSSSFNGAVPAIAISTDAVCSQATAECTAQNAAHFKRVAQFLVAVVDRLKVKPGILSSEPGLLPPGVGLNINYPPLALPAGVVVAQQGRTLAVGGNTITLNFGCYGNCATAPVGVSIPGGITGATPDTTPEVKDADTTAFLKGYITIVPITPDYSAQPVNKFNSVFKALHP